MAGNDNYLLISPAEMQSTFANVLVNLGFSTEKAKQCADVFTDSSVDGVYTHGVNRFATFVEYVTKGFVKPDAEPSLKNKSSFIEQWDGNLGPGILNATFATSRAMELSRESAIACVTLSNTNHWMRGGTYAWQAAKAGYAFIGFTNTIPNMPAWGAIDKRLGNNPFVIAVPYQDQAIVLDMAMSQYSFGALQQSKMKNEELKVPGGFDENGQLSKDPSAIIATRRLLPAGYWKGAGMALLLDMLTTILSGGMSTHEIGKNGFEYGLSQVFIIIDIAKLGDRSSITATLKNIISDYHQSIKADPAGAIVYPGERVLVTRKRNLRDGIPVLREVWDKIQQL